MLASGKISAPKICVKTGIPKYATLPKIAQIKIVRNILAEKKFLKRKIPPKISSKKMEFQKIIFAFSPEKFARKIDKKISAGNPKLSEKLLKIWIVFSSIFRNFWTTAAPKISKKSGAIAKKIGSIFFILKKFWRKKMMKILQKYF